VDQTRSVRYRLPLGLLLLSKGIITGAHLQEALKAQRDSQKGRLGEWLRQQGIVTEEQVTAALSMQWGIPVFHLAQTAGFAECASMTPLPIFGGVAHGADPSFASEPGALRRIFRWN
jgi:hypothetical protein